MSGRRGEIGDNWQARELISNAELGVKHPDKDLAALERYVAKKLPERIEDDTTCGIWQETIIFLDAMVKQMEVKRVEVKAPYLAAERTVDGYFGELKRRAAEAIEKVGEVVGAYLEKKRAAEAKRLVEEAEKLRKAEETKRAEAEALMRAAGSRKTAAAEEKREEAGEVEQEADQLRMKAEEVDATEPVGRVTGSGGSVGGVEERWDFEITGLEEIPCTVLWPFVGRGEKEEAVGRYMRANAPKKLTEASRRWQPLRGVRFFVTTKLRVRKR